MSLTSHNPKAAGSNPGPAMSFGTTARPSLARGSLVSRAFAEAIPRWQDLDPEKWLAKALAGELKRKFEPMLRSLGRRT